MPYLSCCGPLVIAYCFSPLLSLNHMQAIIVSCCGCFHGRTLAAISMSCDNEATHGFGPLLPGHHKVDFGDEIALEKIFKGDPFLSFFFPGAAPINFSWFEKPHMHEQ